MGGLVILILLILLITAVFLIPDEDNSKREITKTVSRGKREMDNITSDAIRQFDNDRRRR